MIFIVVSVIQLCTLFVLGVKHNIEMMMLSIIVTDLKGDK